MLTLEYIIKRANGGLPNYDQLPSGYVEPPVDTIAEPAVLNFSDDITSSMSVKPKRNGVISPYPLETNDAENPMHVHHRSAAHNGMFGHRQHLEGRQVRYTHCLHGNYLYF